MTDAPARPEVDVLIPTVDRPDPLRRAIDSAVSQDYDGIVRVLVHFDGRDGDRERSSDDPRRPVTIMRSPPGRRGLAAARNTMIGASSAPLVAFLDDDDHWRPTKLSQQVDHLDANPGCEVVATGMTVEGGGTTKDRVHDAPTVTLDELIRSRVQDVHPSSLLFRRSALEAIGPVDESLPGSYGEDHDLMIRAARRAPIEVVREPLVRVTWQEGSLFGDKWQVLIDGIQALMDKHPEFATSDVGRARMLGRQAFALASLERYAEARSLALQSLRLNPRDLRGLAALVVGSRLMTSATAQRLANAAGRGI